MVECRRCLIAGAFSFREGVYFIKHTSNMAVRGLIFNIAMTKPVTLWVSSVLG